MSRCHQSTSYRSVAETATTRIDFSSDRYSDSFARHQGNADNVRALAVFWIALLGDSPVDSRKPPRIVRTFALRLVQTTEEVIREFSSLYDRLTSSLIRAGDEVTIDQFIDEFKETPVFREYLAFYKTKDPSILQWLSSFLLFGKKSYYENPSYDAIALRDWCELEERMNGFELDDLVAEDLSVILDWFFRDFDDELYLPRHGSGAVSERKVKTYAEKNSITGMLSSLTDVFERFDTFDTPGVDYGYTLTHEAENKVSRLKFVPKDIGKTRSICMEPALLQYAQQGVRLWVESALESSLGDHIPLRDQSANQRMAWFGSSTGLVDTIDLSSASDSVHIDIIERCMPDTVLPYLMATRSTTVDIGERLVDVSKFAPMGSALCFPVQCAIFASVVLRSSLVWLFNEPLHQSLRLHRDVLWYYYDILYGKRGKLIPFSVYGDDIICDARITPIVIETLTLLGFTVNEGKSFTGSSAFRESCGGYYFAGSDVTPLRAKFKKVTPTLHLQTLAGLIDLANRAYTYGYVNLRKHVIRMVLYAELPVKKTASGINPILFTSDPQESMALLTPNPRNTHLARRPIGLPFGENNYQSEMIRSLTYKPCDYYTLSGDDDSFRHIAWWRSRLHGTSDQDVPMKIPADTRPGWRWTTHSGI